MQKRSVNCILSLAKKRPGQNILIVAHAGVIRGLISHFLDLDYAENLKRRISHRYLGDLTFDGESCVRYHELGKPSGFVKDEVIEVPVDCNKENNPGTSVNR
jgi:broad specificity phosphatase PhoE